MASDAIFKYIKSHFSRARCVTNTYEVSSSTNSGFADLIEWYSLYFGPPYWTWKSRRTQNTINTILTDLQTRISRKWHFLSLNDTSGSTEITIMYLNMASEATGPHERTETSCIVSDWVSQVKGEINKQTNKLGGHLGFKCQMISEHGKNLSIRSGLQT